MAIFKRGKSTAPVPAAAAPAVEAPAVTFDRFFANPVLSQAHDLIAAGDWRTIQDLHGDGTDWDLRAQLTMSMRDVETFPDDWVRACPDAQLPRLVRGAHLMIRAWDVRGSGKGETVDPRAWGGFHSLLNQAEEDLFAATEMLPEDPSPWAFLLTSGMGLEVSKDEILRRFHEADARLRGFQYAHLCVITAVAKKWSGSHELMFDVARTAHKKLPDGSGGRIAIAKAHEERRGYYVGWEKNMDMKKSYYKQPDVAAEIEAAARKSVLSKKLRPNAATPSLQSHFAFALALTGDAVPEHRVLAATLFDAIGDTGIPSDPWTGRWGSGAGTQYHRIRALCRGARDTAM